MKRFNPSTQWQPDVFLNPVYATLNALFEIDKQLDWPSCDWLNCFAHATVGGGHTIEFVENAKLVDETRYYEAIIYETGQVPTREDNWHDLFGALIWCLFPRTKALLNVLHMQDIQQSGLKTRTPMRNAITLWDECGVLVVTTNLKRIEQLQNHQWQDVFITHRDEWGKEIEAVMFGHANYEMMTAPFEGLTGKLLPVIVDELYFSLSTKERYAFLDEQLVQMISSQHILKNNKSMSPLPLLGIPGWWHDNENSEFYSNTDYFRPKRTHK
ncbi:DUF3025 domain-containing protein [Pseudoalteromonas xiamenensis]|uniref:DUF3025 domain-containing protein n=1 Tax=Pseudoalteromonas xiamenensis TaxID=882626 RepID=UPI0027E4643C|nr:DUF3025 domain-containing protein [Pseudoalteromonas xiamenensis]WMN59940.1 DUF3025 domain-containing protein [Pseudoalteromonas xiamenensis]